MATEQTQRTLPTMILNDGKETIEFPEVEPLPPPKASKPEIKEETPRQRFIAISMRVMTKLAMGENPFLYSYTLADFENGRVPEFEKRAEDQKQRDKEKANAKAAAGNKNKKKGPGHVAWGKANTMNSQYIRDKDGRLRRQLTETKIGPKKPMKSFSGGNKFASLVRLARFKKMSSGKGDGQTKQEEEEEKEEPEELPKNPRFCATLSAEAQYAMLKGYVDVLLNTFSTVFTDWQVSLFRVKTPHKPINCLYLAEEERHEPNEEERDRESTITDTLPPTIAPTPTPTTISASSSSQSVPAYLPGIPRSAGLHRTASLVGKLNTAHNYLQVNPKKVPKDKQLKLTMRFQKAQDILDTVRLSQGNLITSPRAAKFIPQNKPRRKKDNPMDHYNAWSHAWSKEFKLHYGMGSHNQSKTMNRENLTAIK